MDSKSTPERTLRLEPSTQALIVWNKKASWNRGQVIPLRNEAVRAKRFYRATTSGIRAIKETQGAIRKRSSGLKLEKEIWSILTPPRAALALLNLFASEPDLAHVVGDLSEEFQQRASAHGHRAAKLWYWQETFRNAMVLGKRELLRTPGKVLAASLLTGVNSDLLIALVMGPVLEHIQGAWFPRRFWPWYRAHWSILIPAMLFAASGAVASLLVRSREFALVASFATMSTVYTVWVFRILSYSSARGRLPAGESLSQLNERAPVEWAGAIIFYSIGCFWIRWHRLARRPSRTRGKHVRLRVIGETAIYSPALEYGAGLR